MRIQPFHSEKLNGYFVTGREGTVAIDPVLRETAGEAEALSLHVETVLMTHCHIDNACGCERLRAAGAKVGCLDKEVAAAAGYAVACAMTGEDLPPLEIDFTFKDGETLHLCGLEIEVIATPGFSKGSCCFLVKDGEERALFTGHTLYRGGADLQTRPIESRIALMNSFLKLFEYPDCTVYPAAGETTTLAEEKNGFKL